MTDIKFFIDPLELHKAQKVIYDCTCRFSVVECGRRFGKTHLAERLISDDLIAGKSVFYSAANIAEIFAHILTTFWGYQKLSVEKILDLNDSTIKMFQLPNGGRVQMMEYTNHRPEWIRGTAYDRVIVDDADSVKDSYLWDLLRPALIDRKGSALFMSTLNPLFRRGSWFRDLYKKAKTFEDPNWCAFSFPTSVNPHIDPSEIENMRGDLADDMFREQILAEIVESSE